MSKAPEAFRTISEAAEVLGVPAHVLRFWESKFSFIRPMKLAGGRRFYRPRDLAVLASVQRLLHGQGFTIKGVQKLYKEHGIGAVTGDETIADKLRASLTASSRRRLGDTLGELQVARDRLEEVLPGKK
ncbi:MAG TPA: MerR family transcriptional regulator [Caulobacteraceae bacterium]|jgi:DNA-binding transcriptional MerR regulator|nr:MerR family transcriptional regulator [Caulobacteraceae bacterium]